MSSASSYVVREDLEYPNLATCQLKLVGAAATARPPVVLPREIRDAAREAYRSNGKQSLDDFSLGEWICRVSSRLSGQCACWFVCCASCGFCACVRASSCCCNSAHCHNERNQACLCLLRVLPLALSLRFRELNSPALGFTFLCFLAPESDLFVLCNVVLCCVSAAIHPKTVPPNPDDPTKTQRKRITVVVP